MNIYSKSIVMAVLASGLAACSQQEPAMTGIDAPLIIAYSNTSAETRSMIDGNPDGSSVAGILWTPGDELGVFAADGATQYRYVKANQTDREAKCAFKAYAGGPATPRYAYYPYHAGNDGLRANLLGGEIPQLQSMDKGEISGDYKYGTANASDSEGYQFEFRHLFSLARVDVDASGTLLSGETLKSVEVTASRGGSPVALTGDFTFSAANGSYTPGANLHDGMVMTWDNGTTLSGTVTGYVSLFPSIRTGDTLHFTVTTDRHVATFSATAKLDFQKEHIYCFPITLSSRDGLTVAEIGSQAPEPVAKSGTFTCATLNVNGLRTSGSDTGNRITADGWDFFSVSEDFSHSSFIKGLSDYDCGEAPGSSLSRTDGIVLFWKKEGFTATGETRVKYNSSYGNIFNGADETKDKGFRFYLLKLDDGTEIDVYITHMNSGSETGHLNARKDQLQQLAEYIITHNNGRPIIFMGDTNCRYTRDYVKTLLIDPLAQAGIVGNDPWIDLQWNGVWPNCPSSSIMVGASDGKTTIDWVDYPDDDNNGAGYGYQKGEVVDKIIYFNQSAAKVKLKALSYLHDESYGNLSDHWPVVVKFEYTSD